MRTAFVSTLLDLAERDPRILLLTGDLGFSVVEPFAERFPRRFYNMGVAEQNMVGVATGLAEAGFLPFVYSIVPFAVYRPFEFIRNGPALQHLPVRIVGVGGGFEYGLNGPTHFGVEDVAVMRALPGMSVVAPVDHRQAATALAATAALAGPIYYRLGKDDVRRLDDLDGEFALGRLQVVRGGEDVALVALGPLAFEAVEAAELLAESGVRATVAALASVSPPPRDDLAQLAARVPLLVTVEAHRVSGGIGSLVAEVVAEEAVRSRVVRLGVGDTSGAVGGERHLLATHGLTAEQIAARVLHELGAPALTADTRERARDG